MSHKVRTLLTICSIIMSNIASYEAAEWMYVVRSGCQMLTKISVHGTQLKKVHEDFILHVTGHLGHPRLWYRPSLTSRHHDRTCTWRGRQCEKKKKKLDMFNIQSFTSKICVKKEVILNWTIMLYDDVLWLCHLSVFSTCSFNLQVVECFEVEIFTTWQMIQSCCQMPKIKVLVVNRVGGSAMYGRLTVISHKKCKHKIVFICGEVTFSMLNLPCFIINVLCLLECCC